jgi:hypothetical protein
VGELAPAESIDETIVRLTLQSINSFIDQGGFELWKGGVDRSFVVVVVVRA